MTKTELLKKIDTHAKTSWLCVNTIVYIAQKNGKGYPFNKNGDKKYLEKVLSDLDSGKFFVYPF